MIAAGYLLSTHVAAGAGFCVRSEILFCSGLFNASSRFSACCDLGTSLIRVPNHVTSDASTTVAFTANDVVIVVGIASLPRLAAWVPAALELAS